MKIDTAAVRRPGIVTLEMVARLANVSPSTVSRILNGTAVVSGAKKEAVEQAVAQLGFVPNPVARGLAGGRTLSIGVVTQAIDSPFYGLALRGIEDLLQRAGYSSLFVSGHWDSAEETRCIDILRARRVDGIIVLTGRLSDSALRNLARELPIVVTGRRLRGARLFSLNFDNFEGARLAVQHLLELGHREIAFIAGDPAHPDANERLRGYRSAIEAAGLVFTPELVVQGSYHEESGLEAINRLLDSRRRFTAVFAANDQMALGVYLGLHRRNLQVPQHVSVVGFDDLAISRFSVPPLTTIHHPAYELGVCSAESMLQLLRGERPSDKLPEPRVVVRESSGPPA